jgi:hypothetical protein
VVILPMPQNFFDAFFVAIFVGQNLVGIFHAVAGDHFPGRLVQKKHQKITIKKPYKIHHFGILW